MVTLTGGTGEVVWEGEGEPWMVMVLILLVVMVAAFVLIVKLLVVGSVIYVVYRLDSKRNGKQDSESRESGKVRENEEDEGKSG